MDSRNQQSRKIRSEVGDETGNDISLLEDEIEPPHFDQREAKQREVEFKPEATFLQIPGGHHVSRFQQALNVKCVIVN